MTTDDAAPPTLDGAAPTALDRAIAWVSPSWGANRARARASIAAISAARAYFDGATIGRRGASIRRSAADANVVTAATLPRLRAGMRDLVRNNPHARRATETIVSNVVGTGIQTQFWRGAERADAVEAIARRWFNSTAIDLAGRMTFFGMQSTAFQAMVEAGGVLIRRHWRRPEDGFTVPLRIQILEVDYIDLARDGKLPDGGRIVQGVEFAPDGRRRGYWLFDEHPGGAYATGRSEFVDARDVQHVYRSDRPGQVHGVPWGSSVLLRMADLSDYEDAQLMRQKIAACYAVFIKDSYETPGAALGGSSDTVEALEPGMIERLPPGTEIQFSSPPAAEGYAEYVSTSLHTVAAGWGISYEALTGDLKGTSFSSGKMGRNEMDRNVDRWRRLIFMPQFCDVVARWFLEALELVGLDTAGVEVRHVAPAREMIDPPRELKAKRDAIRAGQMTYTQNVREQGRDPEEHFRELASDFALLDSLGIVLDSDARQRTNAGLSTASGVAPGAGDDADEGAGESEAAAAYFEMLARLDDLEAAVALSNGRGTR